MGLAPAVGVLLTAVVCWPLLGYRGGACSALVVDRCGNDAFISRCIFSNRGSIFIVGSAWAGCSGFAASAMSGSILAKLAWPALSASACLTARECFLCLFDPRECFVASCFDVGGEPWPGGDTVFELSDGAHVGGEQAPAGDLGCCPGHSFHAHFHGGVVESPRRAGPEQAWRGVRGHTN